MNASAGKPATLPPAPLGFGVTRALVGIGLAGLVARRRRRK